MTTASWPQHWRQDANVYRIADTQVLDLAKARERPVAASRKAGIFILAAEALYTPLRTRAGPRSLMRRERTRIAGHAP